MARAMHLTALEPPAKGGIRPIHVPAISIQYDKMMLSVYAHRVFDHLSRLGKPVIENGETRYQACCSLNEIAETCFRGSYPTAQTPSLRRKAIDAIKELEARRMIQKIHRRDELGTRANAYDLLGGDQWVLPEDLPSESTANRNIHKTNARTTKVSGVSQKTKAQTPGVPSEHPPDPREHLPSRSEGTPPLPDPIRITASTGVLNPASFFLGDEINLPLIHVNPAPGVPSDQGGVFPRITLNTYTDLKNTENSPFQCEPSGNASMPEQGFAQAEKSSRNEQDGKQPESDRQSYKTTPESCKNRSTATVASKAKSTASKGAKAKLLTHPDHPDWTKRCDGVYIVPQSSNQSGDTKYRPLYYPEEFAVAWSKYHLRLTDLGARPSSDPITSCARVVKVFDRLRKDGLPDSEILDLLFGRGLDATLEMWEDRANANRGKAWGIPHFENYIGGGEGQGYYERGLAWKLASQQAKPPAAVTAKSDPNCPRTIDPQLKDWLAQAEANGCGWLATSEVNGVMIVLNDRGQWNWSDLRSLDWDKVRQMVVAQPDNPPLPQFSGDDIADVVANIQLLEGILAFQLPGDRRSQLSKLFDPSLSVLGLSGLEMQGLTAYRDHLRSLIDAQA